MSLSHSISFLCVCLHFKRDCLGEWRKTFSRKNLEQRERRGQDGQREWVAANSGWSVKSIFSSWREGPAVTRRIPLLLGRPTQKPFQTDKIKF